MNAPATCAWATQLLRHPMHVRRSLRATAADLREHRLRGASGPGRAGVTACSASRSSAAPRWCRVHGARDVRARPELSSSPAHGDPGSATRALARGRPRPPAAISVPTIADPRRGRQRGVHPDDLRRQLESVLDACRSRPGWPAAAEPRHRRELLAASPRRRASTFIADRDEPEHRRQPRALRDHPVQCLRALATPARSMTSPVPAPPACGPDAVAAVPRKMVAAPSGTRARTAQTVTRGRSTAGGCLPPRLAGAIAREEGDGGGQEQHRQDVVPHDEAGREVVLDGEAAEDRLADDAERQQQADRGPRSRRYGRRRKAPSRRRRREADDARQHAVAELDERVGLELGVEGGRRALRPVGQPRPEPVTRTPAPVTTIRVNMTSAKRAISA